MKRLRALLALSVRAPAAAQQGTVVLQALAG